LRDEQIAQWSAKIVAALQGLGGVQRALVRQTRHKKSFDSKLGI
jgi:hypothetical protein